MSQLRFEETGSTSGGVLHGVNVNARSLCAEALYAAGRGDCVAVAGERRVASDDAGVVRHAFEEAA